MDATPRTVRIARGASGRCSDRHPLRRCCHGIVPVWSGRLYVGTERLGQHLGQGTARHSGGSALSRNPFLTSLAVESSPTPPPMTNVHDQPSRRPQIVAELVARKAALSLVVRFRVVCRDGVVRGHRCRARWDPASSTGPSPSTERGRWLTASWTCAFPSVNLPSGGRPAAYPSIAPLYLLLSGGIAAIAHVGHGVPFPSAADARTGL